MLALESEGVSKRTGSNPIHGPNVECKTVISEGVDVQLTASSHKPWRRSKSCQPKDAALNSHRAWCARRKDEHQWLQWDLGPPHLVTGVVTRGRGDTGRKHWVKAYTLTYSNDSKVWFTYKDGNHLDTKVSDKVSQVERLVLMVGTVVAPCTALVMEGAWLGSAMTVYVSLLCQSNFMYVSVELCYLLLVEGVWLCAPIIETCSACW
ncbi:EGF-like repeat and discoidin I-like domain-containing protein 3 [Portunus trituberculatus]|uniref:EGF-like repeat and discoidin I-like domain-containing protein 3 n=1 Tax=Portunus trituberculatus TaxID=210409 RepID=A0A5B7D6K8_PORTR|nr:EGF-like repeat and discoidin I-like domain-containing protein 3 [Portunus trituberculatus]